MKRRVVVQSETIRLLKALIREELNQIGNVGLSTPSPVMHHTAGPLGGVASTEKNKALSWVNTLKEMSPEDLVAMLRDGTISDMARELGTQLQREARRRR